MLSPLPVYKNGEGDNDTGALIGCLRAKNERNYAVRVYHFGQVDSTDRIRQSEIDTIYEMDLLAADIERGSRLTASITSAVAIADSAEGQII
jgi:hypothetical protein